MDQGSIAMLENSRHPTSTGAVNRGFLTTERNVGVEVVLAVFSVCSSAE